MWKWHGLPLSQILAITMRKRRKKTKKSIAMLKMGKTLRLLIH